MAIYENKLNAEGDREETLKPASAFKQYFTDILANSPNANVAIEVGVKPLFGSNFVHSFTLITVTSLQGESYRAVLTGGPSNIDNPIPQVIGLFPDAFDETHPVPIADKPVGDVKAWYGIYGTKGVPQLFNGDEYKGIGFEYLPINSYKLIDAGTLSQKISTIHTILDNYSSLAAAQHKYDLLYSNCNTILFEALKAAGLTPELPTGPNGETYIAPGAHSEFQDSYLTKELAYQYRLYIQEAYLGLKYADYNVNDFINEMIHRVKVAMNAELNILDPLPDDIYKFYLGTQPLNESSPQPDRLVIELNENDRAVLLGDDGRDILSYKSVQGGAGVHVNLANSSTVMANGTSTEIKDYLDQAIKAVVGTQYADIITGNEGNNWLTGGAGSDELHGGLGFDWLEYEDDVTQGVNVSITAQDSINGGFSGTVDEVVNVEDTVVGTTTPVSATDIFTGIEGIFATDYGDTVTLDDPITGGQILSLELGLGANVLNLSNQADNNLNFFISNERLHSTSSELGGGSLTINGNGGNDHLYGSTRSDTLNGGGQDDTLEGGGSSDLYIFGEGDGEDTIRDIVGEDRIYLEDVDLIMFGDATTYSHSYWNYELQFGTETAYLRWEGDPNNVASRGDLIVDFDATFYYDIVIENFSNGEFGINLEGAAPGDIDPGTPDDPIDPFFTNIGEGGEIPPIIIPIGNDTISLEGGFDDDIHDRGGNVRRDYPTEGGEDDSDTGWKLEGEGGNGGHWLTTGKWGINDGFDEGGNPGVSAGDPHLLTFDGLFYDFQDTGEFTLTQSTDTNPFTIQARMQEFNLGDAVGDKFSVNTAIATELGSSTVGFYISGSLPYDFEAAALDDNRYNDQFPNLYINDSAFFMPDNAVVILDNYEGYVYRQGNQYTVVNELGDTLRVQVNDTHLDMTAYAAAVRATGTLEGLLGNYDGDTTNEYTLDDGTNLGDTISVNTLYDTFGEDWRITQGESLFLYGEGQNTSSFDNPDFIPTLRTVDDFDAATVAAAEAAAIAEGFDPTSAIFDAAVLDFIVMGEVEYNQVWQAAELRTAVAQANITEYGDDLIEGTSASDAIYGTDEQDYILAYDSNDTVYADDGDDIIIGGLGDDILYGQGGADRFVHYQGDGNDHIYGGQYNSQNVIFMYDAAGNWLTQDDMQFIVGSRDLQIMNRDSGEIITIDNQYYSAGKTVASVNGIDISGALSFSGTDGGDNLVGTEFNDTIEAGLGNDTIYGDHGDDTYIHREGDGNDHIYSGEYNSNDVIFMYDALGGLLPEEDLQFIISSRDLQIVNRNNGETVTVDNQYYSAGKTVFSVNGIDISGAMNFVGTDAIDVITATEFNDTIEGGLGNDTIYGDDGDDVYIHHYGDGNDHLHSGEYNSNDVVFMYDSLGGMLAEADLLFSVYGYDLRVEDRESGEYVILDNQYYSSGKSFAFVNNIAIDAGLNIVATDDAETFYGTEYDDTLVGGGGDDIIYGDDGDDVYLHYRGDGNDHLLSGEYNSLDAVYMYDDNNNLIPEADLQFIVSSNDLIVKDRISGETVTLDNAYYSAGNTFATVNNIDLSGGVHSVGTSAGESIYGTEYADTLEGAGGTDYVYGGAGHDIFIHREGDGSDYLFNNGYNQTDEIFMFDDLDMQIVQADLMFTQSGADMVVTHTANSETLVLDNFFYSQGSTFGSLNGIDLDTVI